MYQAPPRPPRALAGKISLTRRGPSRTTRGPGVPDGKLTELLTRSRKNRIDGKVTKRPGGKSIVRAVVALYEPNIPPIFLAASPRPPPPSPLTALSSWPDRGAGSFSLRN